MNEQQTPIENRPPDEWELQQPFGWKHLTIVLIVFIILSVSAQRTEIYTGVGMIGQWIGDVIGLVDDSDVGKGLEHFLQAAFPFQLSEKTEVNRIENFDRNNLPMFSYIVKEPLREYNLEKDKWVVTEEIEYLVRPVGYLFFVIRLMFETIEIAIWGTLLAVILAMPLAYFASRGYTPNMVVYNFARGLCSLSRSIPELISAMFLVLMFGFGAFPGVLALGLHTCGFLGKFFADDIENTEKGPQEGLRGIGASKIKVLRFAVLPQVLPQFLAYLQYILERNVRTATVLGIVGAGGIGMELKGRWDMSDFGHVSTILLIIFITVFVLEHLTQNLRKNLI